MHAEATKIAKETKDANVIAAQVAAELERALPALQEAEAALNVLTKKDISELKVGVGLCGAELGGCEEVCLLAPDLTVLCHHQFGIYVLCMSANPCNPCCRPTPSPLCLLT